MRGADGRRGTFRDGDWRVETRNRPPRFHADGPYCRLPRMTLDEFLALPFDERDHEDWGARFATPHARRRNTGPRVSSRRHTYWRDETPIIFGCPTELAIWLDQQVAGVPGGRKALLVPLLAAWKASVERQQAQQQQQEEDGPSCSSS